VTYLEAGKELEIEIKENRQAYVVEIENDVYVNDLVLKERDALEVIEETLLFKSQEGSHILLIEMEKSQ
jgi:redox-sensitive bicupin YhaK (pirin superfamily)